MYTMLLEILSMCILYVEQLSKREYQHKAQIRNSGIGPSMKHMCPLVKDKLRQ